MNARILILFLCLGSLSLYAQIPPSVNDNAVVFDPDTMPSFKGCNLKHVSAETRISCTEDKISVYLSKNFNAELLRGIMTNTQVRFIVETDSTIREVQILKSINTEFDKEIERVIKSTTGWIPGRKKGRDVRCMISMPLSFRSEGQAPTGKDANTFPVDLNDLFCGNYVSLKLQYSVLQKLIEPSEDKIPKSCSPMRVIQALDLRHKPASGDNRQVGGQGISTNRIKDFLKDVKSGDVLYIYVTFLVADTHQIQVEHVIDIY